MYGNPRLSWIQDFTPWIPDSRPAIPVPCWWNSDSGYHAMDSGFQACNSSPLSVELGFRIPIVSVIADALSCIPDSKAHGSGFHKKNFPDSRFQKQNFLDSGIP